MAVESTSTNPQPQDNLQTSGLTDAIVKKMLESSSIVSSTTSNIDERIASAIAGVKQSTADTSQSISSQFGREIGYTQEAAAQALTSGRAAGSGGVMNMAALRELTMTTDKSLKDLDQRRQELILQNNAQGAAQVSALQIQALDFKQKAEQQTFANLLGMANFSVQSAQEKRLSQAQSFTEKSAIASVGLQYGIPVKEGDTIESITARAAPLASKKQQAELLKIQAETRRIDAEARKAANGDGVSSYDSATIKALANSAFALSQDPTKRAEYENILGTVTKGGNKALETFYNTTLELQKQKADADIVAAIQKQSSIPADKKRSLVGDLIPFGTAVQNKAAGFLNYLTGTEAFEKLPKNN